MQVSSQDSEKIRRVLKSFIEDTEPFILNLAEPVDLRRVAAELEILPMAFNFSACYAIRPDGSIVVLDLDQVGPYELATETDPRICRLVLCQGAKKHPALSSLVPSRPLDAADCRDCEGTGVEPMNVKLGFAEERIVCWCGGLGWLPNEECQLLQKEC